jgi:hypothetical protein
MYICLFIYEYIYIQGKVGDDLKALYERSLAIVIRHLGLDCYKALRTRWGKCILYQYRFRYIYTWLIYAYIHVYINIFLFKYIEYLRRLGPEGINVSYSNTNLGQYLYVYISMFT